MSVLNRMKLWQKLAALVLVLSMPMIFLGIFHFSRLNAEILGARNELEGVSYTKALGSMLADVATHRSRMREARATSSPAALQALDVSDKKVNKIVAEIDAIDGSIGKKFDVSQQWQAIRSLWVDLKTNQTRLEMAEASNRHDRILAVVMKHVERVALRSGLSREPDISTFIAIRLAGDVRRYVNVSIIDGELSAERRTKIALSEKLLEYYLEKAREGVQDSTDLTSAALQPAIDSAEAAFTNYDAFIKVKVLNAEKLEIQTADAYKASREPTATLGELGNVAFVASTAALQARLSAITIRRSEIAAVIGIALAAALALVLLISRSLTRPMNQAIAVFHAIAAGMYDNRIEYSGTDEASQVLQSLDGLQRKLRTESAGGLSQAISELRIKSALDKARSRIILADENFKIIYVNGSMQQFLFEARADLRRDLPRLDVDHIIGTSVEGLFKNQANQRRVLQEAPTYAADLNVGERVLQVVTNAVVDPDGKRIGTMVELIDRHGTARILASAANA